MNRAQGRTSSLALPKALTESSGGAGVVGPVTLEPVIVLTLVLGRSCTEAPPLEEKAAGGVQTQWDWGGG